MPRFIVLLVCVVSASIPSWAQEDQPRVQPSVRQAPAYSTDLSSLVDLIEAINSAPAEDYFSVKFTLDMPIELGVIRTLTDAMMIPRVMADVDLGPQIGPRPVNIGTFYPDGSWDHSICRIRTSAKIARLDYLETISPEKWPVIELYVYGSAQLIRELVNGTFANRGSITDGSRQDRRHEATLVRAIRREHAKKMELPANFSVPPGCEQFAKVAEAPYLSGMPVYLTPEETKLDPKDLLRRQLGGLTPNTPVTLTLNFNAHQNAMTLGALVSKYNIDGLYANFSPEGDDHLAILVELSIHGGSIHEQVNRVDCMTMVGDGKGNYYEPSSWFTTRAEVSLDVANATALIADPGLATGRLASVFQPGELSRLEAYYARKEAEGHPISRTVNLPSECQAYFRYID